MHEHAIAFGIQIEERNPSKKVMARRFDMVYPCEIY